MQFQVIGANSESGDDIDVMLDAPSRDEVERIAHERGILVSSITPHAAAAPQVHHDPNAIALVEDDPHLNGAPLELEADDLRPHGLITVNANNPGDTAHTGAGHAPGMAQSESPMEYHIIMNQSLYLLESSVNKHTRDNWEPQGGVTVGVSNNAMQYFQAMIRRKKVAPPA